MEIIYANGKISYEKNNTYIALGNFDGVHIGHQSIIKATVNEARKHNLVSCVYTFACHPSVILGVAKPLLTTNDEKSELLDNLGVNTLIFDDFRRVKNLSPEEFCKEILVDTLGAAQVFCGENYHFGKNGAGNTSILKEELSKYGVKVNILPFTTIDNKIVSSTEIRGALTTGNIELCNDMLGRNYSFSGRVVHGKRLGRTLGFPTLNISIEENKLTPEFGVYLTTTIIEGKEYNSISNIGIRPTTDKINNSCVNCETYVLDYNADAYDKGIRVNLIKKFRNEIKFNGIEELKVQLSEDEKFARKYFKNL